jgi:hypothetical protein
LYNNQFTFFLSGNPESSMAGADPDTPSADWFGYFGDSFGKRVYGGGAASPADLAANLSGYYFWKELSKTSVSRPRAFDICDHINPGWDHLRNPNVPGALRSDAPPVPVFADPAK